MEGNNNILEDVLPSLSLALTLILTLAFGLRVLVGQTVPALLLQILVSFSLPLLF